MAQFHCGMEATPYDGWAFSGTIAVGDKLSLTPAAFDACSSLTGWTSTSGTDPTVEFSRFKTVSAASVLTAPSAFNVASSGLFDVRLDYDFQHCFNDNGGSGSGLQLYIEANYAVPNRYFRWGLTSSMGWSLDRNVNVTGGSNAPRVGTLRFTRTASNTWTGTYWDYVTEDWAALGANATGTLSDGGGSPTATFRIGNSRASGTSVCYFRNFRNALTTTTSGTAESPVYDTVDGFRGVGWFDFSGSAATGTTTVEYRVGATSGACSAASYSAATNFARVTPDAGNRYVQVRVTLTATSGTASREVGPVLLDGSYDSASAKNLFKRLASSLKRFTQSGNVLAVNEVPSTAAGGVNQHNWPRAGLGVGRWLAAGLGGNITYDGTTWALDQQYVDGSAAMVTAQTGTPQLNVEAANAMLPGLVYGDSTLAALTSSLEAAWNTAIAAQLGQGANTNWDSFTMTNRACFNALRALRGGSVWNSQADASFDNDWTRLDALYTAGSGAWDDSPTYTHYDQYTSVIAFQLAFLGQLKAGYKTSEITARLTTHNANFFRCLDPEGEFWWFGRSCHSASRLHVGTALLELTRFLGATGYKQVREYVGRSIWSTLKYTYNHGHDCLYGTPVRTGSLDATEGYASRSLLTEMLLGYLGEVAADTAIEGAPDQFTFGVANAHTWPGAGIGVVYDGGADSPTLQLHALNYDLDPGAGSQTYYASKYNARVTSPRFGQNVGTDATNRRICPQNCFFEVRSDALSSNNFCWLLDATAGVYHLGKAVAMRRTGTMRQGSATIAMTATGPTATDLYFAYGNHVVAVSKIVAGAANLTVVRFASPPLPLYATGDVIATATGTATGAWATGAQPGGKLSVFLRGLTSNLDTTELATDYYAFGSQENRIRTGGRGVALLCGSSQTGDVYLGVDVGLKHATMVGGTEAVWVADYARSGDVVEFTADDTGIPADVCLAFTAQNFTGHVVNGGSYALTGGSVVAFSGKQGAADWAGGQGLTLVTFGGNNLFALASAGNASFEKVSVSRTRVWWDGAADLTLYADALPATFSRVFARGWDGGLVDITSGCTVTPNTSIVVPSSAAAAYDVGIVTLDITSSVTGAVCLAGEPFRLAGSGGLAG